MTSKAKKYVLQKNLIDIEFISPDDSSHFFGYYDKSPLNTDNDKLLAHKVFFEGRNPSKDDIAEVGYFNLKDGSWIKIAETKAFNWQQGSMLQWIGPDFNSKIIYNDADNNQFVSKMVDIKSYEFKKLPKAIYSIDPLGKFAISLHFERS
ncbi:MAG: hypothetical protein MI922_30210, partial [Bacteroidales bacterium]|nr:hypothetical protein [Bacteroidales bacterium]